MLDRNKFGESWDGTPEDPELELYNKCQIVYEVYVEDKIFTQEEALEAYGVTLKEYNDYLTGDLPFQLKLTPKKAIEDMSYMIEYLDRVKPEVDNKNEMLDMFIKHYPNLLRHHDKKWYFDQL